MVRPIRSFRVAQFRLPSFFQFPCHFDYSNSRNRFYSSESSPFLDCFVKAIFLEYSAMPDLYRYLNESDVADLAKVILEGHEYRLGPLFELEVDEDECELECEEIHIEKHDASSYVKRVVFFVGAKDLLVLNADALFFIRIYKDEKGGLNHSNSYTFPYSFDSFIQDIVGGRKEVSWVYYVDLSEAFTLGSKEILFRILDDFHF